MAESTDGPIDIEVEFGNNEATLRVSGELDLETAGALAAALDSVDSSLAVHLDFDSVSYMDSSGLRAVLEAKNRLEGVGSTLDIVRASNIVVRLLEITGLSDLTTPRSG